MDFELRVERFNSNRVYGLAAQVQGVVIHKIDFDLDYINWLCFRNFANRVGTPHKWSILHETIHGIVFAYFEYMTGHVAEDSTEYFSELLTEAAMKVPSWLTPDSVRKHIHELDRLLHKASKALVPSVFHVLFSDRDFVTQFQIQIAGLVKQLNRTSHPKLLASDGIFKRPTYLPVWLKTGVFHRDHGRCQSCWRDLTGLCEPIIDLHLDHIVPLAQSGTNDPTNFQLLCAKCNLTKGQNNTIYPGRYIPYW